MIIKVGDRGNDARGMVAYLGGPGTIDEHIDPHIVAASITPTGPLDKEMQDQAVADLRVNSKIWPEVQIKGGNIWQSTLAIGKNEGNLPDQKWAAISRDYIQGMDFQDTNWIAVNHGPSAKGNDHVHIVASLVKDNGTQADYWNDRYRSRDLAIQLEDKHGLQPLPGRRLGTGQRADSQKDLARARDQGLPESRRSQIERTVRASASVVSTVSEFEQILKANGLDFHPYKSSTGEVTGYSVSSPETTTKQGVTHRWAGGKLARDLSLPRLQETWKNNLQTKPSHIRAVQELQALQRALPQADALGLEDASHQLAGALASASLAEEGSVPGPLAAASKQAGAYAQTVRAHLRPKPPALGVGMLMLQATDPTGKVGRAVLIKQLMAAYRALLDAQFARRALVTKRERNPSMAGQAGPEEELMETSVTAGITAGAVMVEHRARAKEAAARMTANDPKKDLWDAKSIREFRLKNAAEEKARDAAMKPAERRIQPEQMVKVGELADQFDLPGVVFAASQMTEREAKLYIARMEANVANQPGPGYVPPLTAPEFEKQLNAKHGGAQTELEEFMQKYGTPSQAPEQAPAAAPAAPERTELHRPETWKSGDVPATQPQVDWLVRNAGMTREEAAKMTKAGASSYRNALDKSNAGAVHLTPLGQGPKQAPAKYTKGQGRN